MDENEIDNLSDSFSEETNENVCEGTSCNMDPSLEELKKENEKTIKEKMELKNNSNALEERSESCVNIDEELDAFFDKEEFPVDPSKETFIKKEEHSIRESKIEYEIDKNEKLHEKEIDSFVSGISDKEKEQEKEEVLQKKPSVKQSEILQYIEKNNREENINDSKRILLKKKIHEDQSVPEWYQHQRHFFIFTYSGKPVFTRYGNEENLTSFYGTLLAIISKIESFSFGLSSNILFSKIWKRTKEDNPKNTLKYIISKNTKVVYLNKGVLCLICISKANESITYISNILHYMYTQIISLLTKSIEKALQIKPSYDIRNLLSGTDLLICNLISSSSKNMFSIVEGFEPLPLDSAYRDKIHNAISKFQISNVLLSLVLIKDKVVGIAASKNYSINSEDIAVLINILTSTKSFKNVESWTPLCLPSYNGNLFLYAYINYIDKDVCCVYVCSYTTSREFYVLSQHTEYFEKMLKSNGCLEEIVKASMRCPLELPRLPNIDIIHLCYFIPNLKQYYSSYIKKDRIKRVFRVYQKCNDILKDSKLPAQIYLEGEYEKFYCIKTQLYHLYLTVPFHVMVNDENVNEILKNIAIHHKEIFINNIPQIIG